MPGRVGLLGFASDTRRVRFGLEKKSAGQAAGMCISGVSQMPELAALFRGLGATKNAPP